MKISNSIKKWACALLLSSTLAFSPLVHANNVTTVHAVQVSSQVEQQPGSLPKDADQAILPAKVKTPRADYRVDKIKSRLMI